MDDRYERWINAYVERREGFLLGRCKEAVNEMKASFPELEIVPGHVEVMGWGRRGHWWLRAPDGEIVDPTVAQFPLVFDYEPFKPGSLVRAGKCMECGAEIWRPAQSLDDELHETFCSPECHDAMAAEFG